MALQIGDVAPDFTLKNSEGKEITLSSFNGSKNVLVLFFPLAFTGVCTAELCSTRDSLADYNSMNAEVLAISVDSHFTLKQFKAAEALIDKIKKEVPGVVLRTTMLVGFPGETDEEFLGTMNFLNDIDISYLHVFTYSERDNTEAAAMQGVVPANVRKAGRGVRRNRARHWCQRAMGR